MSGRSILITGAAGLVGHAVRQLLEARGDRVIALDRVAETAPGIANLVCDLTDVHRLHHLWCVSFSGLRLPSTKFQASTYGRPPPRN